MVHMLLVYEKKDITELNCFSFFFLHFARLYKWFLLQQLNPIFVVLELQLKKSTYKSIQDFKVILLQNHYGLGTCCKFECDKSLHRIDMTKMSLTFLSTNQEKLAPTEIGCLGFSRSYCFPPFATGGCTNCLRFDWLIWLRIEAMVCYWWLEI